MKIVLDNLDSKTIHSRAQRQIVFLRLVANNTYSEFNMVFQYDYFPILSFLALTCNQFVPSQITKSSNRVKNLKAIWYVLYRHTLKLCVCFIFSTKWIEYHRQITSYWFKIHTWNVNAFKINGMNVFMIFGFVCSF